MIMQAKTGRRMEMSASFCIGEVRELRVLGSHGLPSLDPAGVEDHALSLPQAGNDLNPVGVAVTGRDKLFDGLAPFDDKDLFNGGENYEGRRVHRQRRGL